MNSKEFLKQLYTLKNQSSKTIELLYYFIDINSNNKNNIDKVLKNIDFKEANFIITVSLIRGTFRFRKELQNWDACLKKVVKILKKDNRNYKNLLRGVL